MSKGYQKSCKTKPKCLGRPRARFLRLGEVFKNHDSLKILRSGKSLSKNCKNIIWGGQSELSRQLLEESASRAVPIEALSRAARILDEFRHGIQASQGRRIQMRLAARAPPHPLLAFEVWCSAAVDGNSKNCQWKIVILAVVPCW